VVRSAKMVGASRRAQIDEMRVVGRVEISYLTSELGIVVRSGKES
jgi:hypothetical protein